METKKHQSTINITLNSPIILVGLMGCGKSAIGKRLAAKLSVPFKDSDTIIADKEKSSITNIFLQKGEAYFRQLERDVLHHLMQDQSPQIIATGGGAFINEETRKIMLKESTVIWIDAKLDTLLRRVSRKKTRPLLEQGDKATILKDLIEKRYPIYAKAHLRVESTDVPHEVTLNNTIQTIQDFYEQA